MKLIATFKPSDVDASAKAADYSTYRLRPAARAVVFDGESVALIHVVRHGYYMLPGGGIDEGEDVEASLRREVAEELGCQIEIGDELGSIEVCIERWRNRQVDTCFIAFKTGDTPNAQTDFEKEEGHAVVWAKNLDEATTLMQAATPANRDGKLIRARDLTFLEYAKKSL